jgi:hypothetical protein
VAAFRVFGLDPAHCYGNRFAFGLPVGGIDGSAVSRGSFCPQG